MMLARHGLEMLETAAYQSVANHQTLEKRLDESQTAIVTLSNGMPEQRFLLRGTKSLLEQILYQSKTLTTIVAKFWSLDQPTCNSNAPPHIPQSSLDLRFGWFQAPVTFEDALGRIIPIPSEYDYELVSALIKAEFKKGPGWRLVDSEKYELSNTTRTGFPITRENWTAFLPGAHVKMAFILEKKFSEGKGCPMPRCLSQNFRGSRRWESMVRLYRKIYRRTLS